MKIVVITAPEFLQGEAGAVAALLDAGVWRIHVRKPGAGASEMSALLDEIPERCRSSISLHDCHELAVRYGLGGVHLNGRNPRPPHGFSGLVSRSCHSFSELSEYASICDYMFLSPVFDSISKQGPMPVRGQSMTGFLPWAVYHPRISVRFLRPVSEVPLSSAIFGNRSDGTAMCRLLSGVSIICELNGYKRLVIALCRMNAYLCRRKL